MLNFSMCGWNCGIRHRVKNEFAARLFTVSVEVTDISGEDEMTVSGNLNAVGDPVDGTFNTATLMFTPSNAETNAPEAEV